MKQDEVLALIIEKTDLDEIKWYFHKARYNETFSDYVGLTEEDISHNFSSSIWSQRETYRFYTGFHQSLKRNGDEIISGILVLRGLHVAIQQQLKQRELDKLSGIYHEILTE